MERRLTKFLTLVVMVIMAIGLFAGCIDYGYSFHFDVEGGNGEITIENENLAGKPSLCSEQPSCTLGCSDTSLVVSFMGGKKGSVEVTFIAKPNEGYQVKEWLFNDEIVEGNKANSYTARVSNEQNYNGVITVRFEAVQKIVKS